MSAKCSETSGSPSLQLNTWPFVCGAVGDFVSTMRSIYVSRLSPSINKYVCNTPIFTCICISHLSLSRDTYLQIPGNGINSDRHHPRGLPEHFGEPCGGAPLCPAGGRLEGNSPEFLIEVELSQLLGGLGWQVCCRQGTSILQLAVLQLQGHVSLHPPRACRFKLPFQGGGCGGFRPQQ